MADVTSTTSCATKKYPQIVADHLGELLIHDDLIDYLKGTPSGAVRDALLRGRTSSAGKLLGIRRYRDRRKLAKFAGLKDALDKAIEGNKSLSKAYEYYAKLLTNPRNNTDLFVALKSLDDANPADSPAKRIIRERLIFEDFEQYAKTQTPGAEKRIDTLQRKRRLMFRQMYRRPFRAYRGEYKKLTDSLILKHSYLDLQATLCQLDPCRSICPAISSITPSKVNQGQETTLVIKGKNLPNHPEVAINPSKGIKILEATRTSPEKVEIKIKVDSKAPKGERKIGLSSWGKLFKTVSTFTVLEVKAEELKLESGSEL